MHQINMRMAVTLLRDSAAEKRAKEKAEAPTVKTEEQTRAEAAKQKNAAKEKTAPMDAPRSVWRRKFRPLPESKAIDLFADVIGDSFILLVAGGLILFETMRTKGKPDANAERIAELDERLKELDRREKELEEAEKLQQNRVKTLEEALEDIRNASGKVKSHAPS